MFRFLLYIIIIMLFLMPMWQVNAQESMNRNEEVSIIVEVEGNPHEHKAYLETYHPFIDVIAVYDQLFNGLALQSKPENLAEIGSLEFIQNVHTVRTYQSLPVTGINEKETNTSTAKQKSDHRHNITQKQQNRNTEETLKLSNAVLPSRLNTTSYTGEGIQVAIIDTGIDYQHPDLKESYQGGADLVDFDDDPMETLPGEGGPPTLHGTHVAGIIAGDGKLQGVAPDAEIYSYRALGPGGMGTSVQVIAAMEQAVEDGADVINLSLGNTVNGPDFPTSKAVNRAAELGVAMVIANGNSGPDPWTVGAPATADHALGIGASADAKRIPYLYEPLTDKKISLTAMMGSPLWNIEKSYEIVHVPLKEEPRQERQNGRPDFSEEIEGQMKQMPDLDGKIALMERGIIPFYNLAKMAEQKGAEAVIIYNNEPGPLNGAVDSPGAPMNIPVAAISQEDGKWMVQQQTDSPLYLNTEYQMVDETVADFSSRGPVTVNWHIKPDVIAPGANILSTVPDGYQALNGTSMAAPHVSGVIALMKEAHPNWGTAQIFGAVKTTALRMDDADGTPLAPTDQGTGWIRPKEAIETDKIIYNPQLHFGKLDNYRQTQTIELTIENKSDQTQEYTFDTPKRKNGLTWELPQSFTIEAGETKRVPVTLSMTSEKMKKGVHQGWITLNEGKETYHLPYLFVNQQADHPKGMGFGLAPKPLDPDTYQYQIYLSEPAKSVEVSLYETDTLFYNRKLFEWKDLKTGMNEGEIAKEELGEPGLYLGVVTIYLKDGTYDSSQTMIYIE